MVYKLLMKIAQIDFRVRYYSALMQNNLKVRANDKED